MLRCEDCGSEKVRALDCEIHKKECTLIICCDCGATVKELTDKEVEQGLISLLLNGI